MAKFKVIDLSGDAAGEVEASEAVFGAEVKEHLLWEAVRVQRARRRAGTAKTKTRAEISRTKEKMSPQKGGGSARHGSRRANVFRGGGVVHGPVPHLYNLGMNKKARASALRSALSLRAREGNLLVMRGFNGETPKTKTIAAALVGAGLQRALLVDSADNRWLAMSTRNLSNAQYLAEPGVNVYDILRFPKLVVSEASLRALESRLAPRARRGM